MFRLHTTPCFRAHVFHRFDGCETAAHAPPAISAVRWYISSRFVLYLFGREPAVNDSWAAGGFDRALFPHVCCILACASRRVSNILQAVILCVILGDKWFGMGERISLSRSGPHPLGFTRSPYRIISRQQPNHF